MLRIGIDYTAAVEEQAGIGRFTRELVAALLAEDREHQYVLLAPRHGRPPEWLGACPNARWAPLPASAWLAAILWQRLRLPIPAEWFTGPVDLFHATDYLLPPLRQARGLVTVHDLSFLRHPELADPRLARYLAEAVPRAVARATLVLADSEHTRQELLSLLGPPPEKVAVVYGGVSSRLHPLQEPETLEELRARYGLPTEGYLLTVARLEPRKNIPTLLQAYRLLRDRHRATPPLLIGGAKGWGYEPIFRTAEALGLAASVRFLGYIPEGDLPTLLAGATVFVYPSYYEGFGLPPLEAMACGTPVVASNASCLPEVLGNAALLVSPWDPEALAEALARALLDAGLRQHLRQRGLAQAGQFTWSAAAQQLLAAYGRAAETPVGVTAP